MKRCSLLLATTGALWAGGCLFAQKESRAEPLQVVEPKCCVREGFDLSPDGRRVNYFDRDWTLHRIDLDADGADKTLPLPRKLLGEKIYNGVHVKDDLWLLALSRENWDIKADGFETRFVLYDFAADKPLADWAAHKGIASKLAFAPKQDWLITADWISDERTVCFWDRKTLKKMAEMDLRPVFHLQKGDGVMVEETAVDPTSSFLAVCMTGGMIRVWDMEKKTWRPAVEDGERIGPTVRFLDGATLAVRYADSDFNCHTEVYDWKAAKLLFRVDLKGGSEIAASPDGRIMALGESRRDQSWIRLWDVAAKQEVAAFRAYDGDMRKMIFTHDGKKLITSGADGTIKVWDVEQILGANK